MPSDVWPNLAWVECESTKSGGSGGGGGADGRGGGGGGGVQQKKGSGFVKPSKENCEAIAQTIERLTQEVDNKARDLRNDINDFVGLEGKGDERQLQTHFKNFQTRQKSLQEQIDKYDKYCKGKGPPPPSLERARQLTGQKVPTRTRVPRGPIERSSPWLWVIPPVLVGLGCLVCPESSPVPPPLLPIPSNLKPY